MQHQGPFPGHPGPTLQPRGSFGPEPHRDPGLQQLRTGCNTEQPDFNAPMPPWATQKLPNATQRPGCTPQPPIRSTQGAYVPCGLSGWPSHTSLGPETYIGHEHRQRFEVPQEGHRPQHETSMYPGKSGKRRHSRSPHLPWTRRQSPYSSTSIRSQSSSSWSSYSSRSRSRSPSGRVSRSRSGGRSPSRRVSRSRSGRRSPSGRVTRSRSGGRSSGRVRRSRFGGRFPSGRVTRSRSGGRSPSGRVRRSCFGGHSPSGRVKQSCSRSRSHQWRGRPSRCRSGSSSSRAKRSVCKSYSPHSRASQSGSMSNSPHGRTRQFSFISHSPHSKNGQSDARSPSHLDRARRSGSRSHSPCGGVRRYGSRSHSPHGSARLSRTQSHCSSNFSQKRAKHSRIASPVSSGSKHGLSRKMSKPSSKVLRSAAELDQNNFCVMVMNLPLETPGSLILRKINNRFKSFGNVISVKLHHGENHRFAVVAYKSQAEQTNALTMAKAYCLFGQELSVTVYKGSPAQYRTLSSKDKKTLASVSHVNKKGLFGSQPVLNKSPSCLSVEKVESPRHCSEERNDSEPQPSRMIFISNLDSNLTKQDLRHKFGRFGEIVDIYINSLPGAARQFAFLQFACVSSAALAIKAMNGAFLGKCQVALSFGAIQPTRCVFVEGLSSALTNEYLIQRFSEHGTVEKVLYSSQRRAALILYVDEVSARKAVKVSRNLKITGDEIVMDYANDSFQLNFCQSILAAE